MSRPSIIKSSQWVLFGKILAIAFQAIANIIFARQLGPVAFGLWGLLSSVSLTLSGFANLGLSDAAYKFTAEFAHRDPEKGRRFLQVILWTQLTLGVVLLTVLWFLRERWEERLFTQSVTVLMVGGCLLYGLILAFASSVNNIVAGLQLFKKLAAFNLLQNAGILLAGIALVSWSSLGVLLAFTFGGLVFTLACSALIAKHDARIFLPPPWQALRELRVILPFSVPSMVPYLVTGPLLTATVAHLAGLPQGAFQLGLFNTANTLKGLLAFIPSSVSPVFGTVIVQEGGVYGNRNTYHQLLLDSFWALGFWLSLSSIGVMFYGDIAFTFYGKAYTGIYQVFLPLAVAGAVSAVLAPANYAMVAKTKIFSLLWLGIARAVLIFLLTLALARHYGALGVAWATLLAEIAISLASVEVAIRACDVPAYWRWLFGGLVLAFIALLFLAEVLPDWGRWIAAPPLAGLCAILILRTHPSLLEQLVTAAPGFAAPFVRRCLQAMAPA